MDNITMVVAGTVGFLIGMAVDYFSWLNRCKKNNLFMKDGSLYVRKKE